MVKKRIPVSGRFVPDIDISPEAQVFDLAINNYPREKDRSIQFPYHYHDNVELNFLEKGSVTYLHCNRLQKIEEGQLGVFWAGYPHRIFAGDENLSMWWITIPRHHFLGWKFQKSFIRRLMLGDIITGKKTSPELDLAMIRRWKSEIPDKKYTPVVLLELEARLRRLEIRMSPNREIALDGRAPNMESLHPAALEMASFIIEHFQDALPLTAIAAHTNLNPSYAARLFKQNFGNTIGSFLQETRVSHAINLLQNTNAKVIDVAYASGFQSTSRFYAAFKSVTGQQPKDYRLLGDG
ncbi:MAG: helix-turn-helix domain-containing protein [Puniceicoccaceae bacterium]